MTGVHANKSRWQERQGGAERMYATCSGGGWGFFQCCRYSERPWIILSRTFAFLKQLIIFYICAVRKEKRKRKSSTLYFSFEREFSRPTPLMLGTAVFGLLLLLLLLLLLIACLFP